MTARRLISGAPGKSSSLSRTAISTGCRKASSRAWRSAHVYAGADRRHAADGGRARADVSLLLVRISFASALIDPDLGTPQILRYRLGHDCGTVINPKIVRGMTMGGIAHGIGAALFEEFAYNEDGQLIAQTFMDYLLPSSHEVPPVEIVHHETPSPHTVLGQKGSGEIRLSRRACGDRQCDQ